MPFRTMPTAAPTTASLDEAFDQLGLSSTERRAYAFLLERGNATPTQIADATGQSRGRIYETLRLLVEHGLAREEPRRPVRYGPVPPADVIAAALESAQRRGHALRDAYAGLAELAPPPPSPVTPTRASDVTVLTGRAAVGNEMRRLATRAREIIHIEGRLALAQRLEKDDALLSTLKEARHRGVAIHLHLGPGVEPALRKSLETKIGPGVLHVPVNPPSTITFLTESTVLIALPQPDDASPEGDDVGYRAESPALVRSLLSRFAPPLDPAQGLVRTAREAIDSAARVLDVLGPQAWGADLRTATPEILEAFGRARTRGVAIRLLLASSNGPSDVTDLRRVAEVRSTVWIPSAFAIVDGHVHHFDADGGAQRVSADPPEVRFLRELFDRLWTDAGNVPG